MFTSATPYHRSLGNGLTLKSVSDPRDVERIAALNAQVFGPNEAVFGTALLMHHPLTKPEYWLFVEDDATQQAVSTLVLVPWTWRYEDVAITSGEMGIVATLESYRGKGLVRALAARHHELLRQDDFDLSHIQGIPYFYRQFGYEYAMPLDVYWHIEPRQLPNPSSAAYRFRLATAEDIPVLMWLYEESMSALDICTTRDESIWRYLFGESLATVLNAETWLVVDSHQTPAGYFRLPAHGFGDGLIVGETSRMSTDMGEAVLAYLKQVAQQRNKPYVRLALPDSNDLLKVARGFGARDDGHYPWQMHIVDVARLLRKLAPVLERRLAASLFAGMTRTVVLNLYREAFELCFEAGKLKAVHALGFKDGGDIRLPPLLLAPLLLGYRSRTELSAMYPDIGIYGPMQHLVDVLFPKLASFIHTVY